MREPVAQPPARAAVAVVIPARGEEPYLQAALESVLAQPEVVQVVVATHDAESSTADAIARHPDPRAQLAISLGPSAGENLDAGLAFTQAPWLAFLDADDRWPAGRLAIALAALDATPGAQLCLGRQRAMDAAGTLLDAIAPAPLLGAALVSRAAAEQIGPFGDGMVAQMRWLLRARELQVPTVEIDDVVLHRRGHPGNLSVVQRPELHREYLALARERMNQARSQSDGAQSRGDQARSQDGGA